MAGGFITNVPVSRPINHRIDRHVDMNGFGWNYDEGMYIPIDDLDSDMYELPPELEAGLDT